MLFNPWRENKRLRRQVDDLERRLGIQRLATKMLQHQVSTMHSRHPVTGRILPKGQ